MCGMRTLVGAAVAVLAVIGMAGCSAGPDKTEAYHTVAHAMPAYSHLTTANLDKAAEGICRLFKAEPSTGWEYAVGVASEGADEAQAGVLVRAAVAADCPEYVKNLPASK